MTEIRAEYVTVKPPQAGMTPEQRMKMREEMRATIIKLAQLWIHLFGGSWLDLMPRAEREILVGANTTATPTLPDRLFDKVTQSGL